MANFRYGFAFFLSCAGGDAMMPALVEFPNALGPGVPLFVQCAWHSEAAQAPQAPDGAPDAVPAPEGLCHLVMIDGNQCWVGTLQQKDLAGEAASATCDLLGLHSCLKCEGCPPQRYADTLLSIEGCIDLSHSDLGQDPWGTAGRIPPTCACCGRRSAPLPRACRRVGSLVQGLRRLGG